MNPVSIREVQTVQYGWDSRHDSLDSHQDGQYRNQDHQDDGGGDSGGWGCGHSGGFIELTMRDGSRIF